MTILSSKFRRTAAVTFVAASTLAIGDAALAKDINISVWSGGTNETESYRVENIEIAADLLERQYALRGEDLHIKVEGKYDFAGWAEFKQAVTLAAEADKAPDIIVSSHLDLAPWSQSGLIAPIEDYLDLDSWPLNNIYPNLLEITSYNGQVVGIPQDAESRPFFFWRDTMKKIGYTDEQIDALPEMIRKGEYTLHDVFNDAKKAVDMEIVQKGFGFFPRPSNGPDYAQFYQSFGGELIDPETGKLILDKKAMTEFYQFFVDCVNAGVTNKNHLGMDWNEWYHDVATGKVAVWHGGTWHYARYTGKEGLDDFFAHIQFSLIPAGDTGVGRANTITQPLAYMISQQDDEDKMEIAAQLIKIASEPRLNAYHAIKSSHLGIDKSEGGVDFYANDRWTSEATERLLPYANSQPNHLKYGQFSELMYKGLETAWTLTKTPEEAVEEIEVEMKAALGDDLIVR